jgi:lipoprotein-releasing system permease protein
MFKSLATTRNLLIFIMTLIVCVAAVNISSTLLMLVFEKHQEIAFLKSTGADPGFISFSFLCTGFYIGILGAFFGIALGLLVAVNINEVIRALDFSVEHIVKPLIRFSGSDRAEPMEFRLLNPSYYLQTIPVTVNFREIYNVAAMVLLISLGASFFPARKAGSLKPLEVLRKHG